MPLRIKLGGIAFIVCCILWFGANAEAEASNMAGLKKAYFAGGCFWCMEGPFEKANGVKNVDSGYANSKVSSPTYEQVSGGNTGAYEAIEVVYDRAKPVLRICLIFIGLRSIPRRQTDNLQTMARSI